jgi:Uma2 family endonuclease
VTGGRGIVETPRQSASGFAFELQRCLRHASIVSVEAPTRLITADEFLGFIEAGLFGPDERVELLDGQIVKMLPPGPWHNSAVAYLTEFLVDHRRGRWTVFVQNTLRASESSIPLPDLALLHRRKDRYATRLPEASDVLILVEAAQSTLRQDRKTKGALYARAGIPEYWIVNEPDHIVEVFRSPVAGVYTVKFRVGPGEFLSPEAFPDVKLDIADLFAE